MPEEEKFSTIAAENVTLEEEVVGAVQEATAEFLFEDVMCVRHSAGAQEGPVSLCRNVSLGERVPLLDIRTTPLKGPPDSSRV